MFGRRRLRTERVRSTAPVIVLNRTARSTYSIHTLNVSKKKRSRRCITLNKKPITELRSVRCHMGLHGIYCSVSCHPTQVLTRHSYDVGVYNTGCRMSYVRLFICHGCTAVKRCQIGPRLVLMILKISTATGTV